MSEHVTTADRSSDEQSEFYRSSPFGTEEPEAAPSVAHRTFSPTGQPDIPPRSEPANLVQVVGQFGHYVTRAAGLDSIQGLSLKELFAEVFQRRSVQELEQHLTIGTETTTPALHEVEASWPKPWVFARALVLSIGVFVLFWFALEQFNNVLLVPGLISVGAFAFPLSMLIFFFELNVVRNVSFYQISRLVLLGGVLSLLLSLILFQLTGLSSVLGASAAGIVEELGKAACLLLVLNHCRYRWTLNGLLFGAAIGMGFGAFESAGFAFDAYLRTAQIVSTGYVDSWGYPIEVMVYDNGPMVRNLIERGVLEVIAGHILWTAAVGGALWRVRGDRPFDLSMLKDPRFLRVLAIVMGVHMIWNLDLGLPVLFLYAKWVMLGFISWVVVFGLVQAGLEEIRVAQKQSRDDVPGELPSVNQLSPVAAE